MGEVLHPDTLGATIADLDRRLRVMEATQRVGLNQLRFCQQTAAAVPSTFGSTEYGTAGNTWLDDQGNVGTGYPTITMVTPARVLLLVGFRALDVGNAAGFRTSTMSISVRIDTAEGYLANQYYQANIDRMYVPLVAASVPVPLVAGEHTFTIGAAWTNNNPAAGTLPKLSDSYLIVLPLSAS